MRLFTLTLFIFCSNIALANPNLVGQWKFLRLTCLLNNDVYPAAKKSTLTFNSKGFARNEHDDSLAFSYSIHPYKIIEDQIHFTYGRGQTYWYHDGSTTDFDTPEGTAQFKFNSPDSLSLTAKQSYEQDCPVVRFDYERNKDF
ncbi:MAG: hypothetical protein ACAH59_01010 [Pseudobdellovibrionaceae bacterium]